MMTGRQKIEAAFSQRGTSEVAAVIPYEDLYIRDKWHALTDYPWWYLYDPSMEHQLLCYTDILSRLGHDWFRVPTFYSNEDRVSLTINQCEDGVYQIDRRNGSAKKLEPPIVGGWSAAGKVESIRPEHLPSTPDEIDERIAALPRIDRSRIEWHGRDALAKAMLGNFGKNHYPIYYVSSPLWMSYGLWGFEDMMVNIATRHDLIEYACKQLLEYCLDSVHKAAALGAEAIWVEECLTDQISPENLKQLNVPHIRRLIDEIRSLGMKSIYYFCGNPAGKWEHILSVGADALALEESKKGFIIDVEDVVEIVRGRCTVLGNLNSVDVLQRGTDEELKAEIMRQLAAGKKNNNRFIMSLGSPITPLTSVQRVRLYCDLVHELSSCLSCEI